MLVSGKARRRNGREIPRDIAFQTTQMDIPTIFPYLLHLLPSPNRLENKTQNTLKLLKSKRKKIWNKTFFCNREGGSDSYKFICDSLQLSRKNTIKPVFFFVRISFHFSGSFTVTFLRSHDRLYLGSRVLPFVRVAF